MREPFKRRKSSRALGIIVLVVLSVTVFPACFPLGQTNQKQIVNPTATRVSFVYNEQGIYDDCDPGATNCLNHLKTIASGGFMFVLNYGSLYGSASQLLAYADEAQAVGLKLIWGMHNTVIWNGSNPGTVYSALAASCDCSDGPTFARYVVNLVKNHPATWGYYVGDELTPDVYAQFKAYSDLIHQADPNHPRLFIGDAEAAVSASHGNSPFYDTAEVIGDDHYPIGRRGYTVASTANVARSVQKFADEHGKNSAMVLQAFSFGSPYYSTDPYIRTLCSPYPSCAPYPTRDQMGEMLRLTLQNAHPRLVLWYSYFDILKSDNPSHHWADLIAAVSSAGYPSAEVQQVGRVASG